MRRKTLVVGVTAAAVLFTVGACGNSSSQPAAESTAGTSTSAAAADAHDPADVTFAQQMIPHHQQAIVMSDMVLGKQGVDPRVLDLANQIKAAQGPEIQKMQTWLSSWGMPTMPMMPGPGGMPSQSMMPSQSAMPGATGMPGMPDMSGMPGMDDMHGMDGMMSDEDMSALQNAQGVEASKLFLTQMIKHHQGAISMAQNEISTGQYPAAITMARSIVTSQQQEIDTMNKILASL